MREVQRTSELRRIHALPARDHTQHYDLVGPLTKLLTKEHVCKGDECARLNGVPVHELRPNQAAVLAEAHDCGGVFFMGRVGAGKTLVSFLLPELLNSDRALLVIPAGIRPQTLADMRVLREHWKIRAPVIMTYEVLAREKAVQFLHKFFAGAQRPVLVVDEGQKLKDQTTAAARRVRRFIREWRKEPGHPWLYYCDMSGTPAKRSIRDMAHRQFWAVPRGCPLPIVESDLLDWANAVDEKVLEQSQLAPGALLDFCSDEEKTHLDETEAARKALGRRMFSTPGVIGTTDAGIATPLNIRLQHVALSKDNDEAFRFLRGDGKTFRGWETPDRWPIADAIALRRHARELALGFFNKWDPRPPIEWLRPRQEWCAAVRDILANNRRELDTEKQVADEVRRAVFGRRCPTCKRTTTALHCRGPEDEEDEDLGTLHLSHPVAETVPAPSHHEAADVYRAWHDVKDTFEPNTVPVWVGSTVLDYAADWAQRNTGIIWIEHVAFGRELAKRTGLSYYGQKGLNYRGEFIGKADPKKSLIASIAANHYGKNLQAWNRALTTSCEQTGTLWEQKLGRLHRDGQLAKEVVWDVVIACREQLASFEQACNDGDWHKSMLLSPAKLSFADISQGGTKGTGWAWAPQRKPTKKEVTASIELLRPTG